MGDCGKRWEVRGSEASENLSDSALLRAREVGKFNTEPRWEGGGKKLLMEGVAEKLLTEGVAETKPDDWEEERDMVTGCCCCDGGVQ